MFYNFYVNTYYEYFMSKYHSHGVTLSNNQKVKLANAFQQKNRAITLRLSNHELMVMMN